MNRNQTNNKPIYGKLNENASWDGLNLSWDKFIIAYGYLVNSYKGTNKDYESNSDIIKQQIVNMVNSYLTVGFIKNVAVLLNSPEVEVFKDVMIRYFNLYGVAPIYTIAQMKEFGEEPNDDNSMVDFNNIWNSIKGQSDMTIGGINLNEFGLNYKSSLNSLLRTAYKNKEVTNFFVTNKITWDNYVKDVVKSIEENGKELATKIFGNDKKKIETKMKDLYEASGEILPFYTSFFDDNGKLKSESSEYFAGGEFKSTGSNDVVTESKHKGFKVQLFEEYSKTTYYKSFDKINESKSESKHIKKADPKRLKNISKSTMIKEGLMGEQPQQQWEVSDYADFVETFGIEYPLVDPMDDYWNFGTDEELIGKELNKLHGKFTMEYVDRGSQENSYFIIKEFPTSVRESKKPMRNNRPNRNRR